jgi:hypothetical protein
MVSHRGGAVPFTERYACWRMFHISSARSSGEDQSASVAVMFSFSGITASLQTVLQPLDVLLIFEVEDADRLIVPKNLDGLMSGEAGEPVQSPVNFVVLLRRGLEPLVAG